MSCALRCPALSRQATPNHARNLSKNNQLLRQLANFHPNQLSSYIGVKLLLPAKGRVATTPQGSAGVRKPIQMSFLGVGAPEAILVAIVALVVFGPKGLAEAARSVGSTLRAFKPTIKEVVQVSQELKGTLEKELGIEELRDAARPTVRPAELGMSENLAGPVSDPVAKVIDPEIEAKRAASAQMAWGSGAAAATAASSSSASEAPAAAATTTATPASISFPAPTAAPAAGPAAVKDIASMSMEELEAELARRRSAAAGVDKRA
ncbi:hypothetical protein VOLCADRAFT_96412 [Volvox carteri f. nagariensis]|uniref:Uncharacterized protein n=1 Tax=Volvox carteri f. nagariensis TaxID=3068 RepID=D8UA15_VOLCA|nr:uncharacterized protein VOLCADRAFT_96412 [Volvox carteri f. nagariensis]EFJ43349.1 hypothetical protein VOLCADRAFT_96412 [Volvox carteri f. nagariensis]|eukprot:XP_002955496.1 hypothetical protein VOLCADRAFT_96412 [Volvox carteri f. nagariensis]